MNFPTVLCIDDHPHVLAHRQATLESLGYRVRITTNGHAAIKLLGDNSVDTVLLEYRLDGMDAEAVANHVKQRFPHLPIILLSAYVEMPERILWLVDEFVLRSEMPDGLKRVLERVTPKRKHRTA